MPNENRPNLTCCYSLVFLAAALYLFLQTFSTFSPVLFAFILMLLLTIAINPVILKLRSMMGGRGLATGLLVLVFLCIAALTAMAFYSPMKRSTTKFIQQLPQYWERIQKPIMKMEQKAEMTEQRLKREVSTEVAQETKSTTNQPPVTAPRPKEDVAATQPASGGFLRSGLGSVVSGVSGSFKSAASNAASIVLIIVTVFFGVIFSSLRPRPILGLFFGLIPEQHHPTAVRISHRIVAFVPKWALATLMGMSIIGTMIFLAMWPLFGFQDALVLGLIALVFESVPYIGPILASVPALLLAAGDGGLKPLWVLLAYIAVQTVENNFIMPVVVGGQLKLHPVAVIFSMLLCVTVFGVLGVLIAMPTVAIIKILHEEIYRPRFLPNVSDDDLENIAQTVLKTEKKSPSKSKGKESGR